MLATDPPTSEAQRRAMWAAASGHSNIGIPKSVGEKFANADPGGKLPLRAKDMDKGDWRGLIHGLIKFFMEERQEPEHGDAKRAAGVAFVSKDGKLLFVRRKGHDHAGEWSFPGGGLEGSETPVQAASREAKEEVGGNSDVGRLRLLDARRTGDVHFSTFAQPVDEEFEPELNEEHDDHRWAFPDEAPTPLHPGVKATLDHICDCLDELTRDVENPSGKLSETTRRNVESQQHREDMPPDAFLGPDRTYPVKEKRDGKWQYTRNLLLAAARRARMQNREDIAKKADSIRAREFGEGGEDTDRIEDRLRRLAARRTGNDMLSIARDSKRSYDQDGRLHVSDTNISKAVINPYWGREIPGYDKLGLDPDKKYRLLRDPAELEKAAKTFNGLPVLMHHKTATAADHPTEITVGATGTDAKFVHPYLTNDIVIWPEYASEAVEDGEQKQLSCSYHYKPDMTPGVYDGESYDGVMRDIKGNHVALVPEGRAGPDVAVADSKEGFTMPQLSRVAATARGALLTYLKPRLAADAKIDLSPALVGLTAKNFASRKPLIVSAVKSAVKGRLAKDADIEDLPELLKMLEEERSDEDGEDDSALHLHSHRDDELGGEPNAGVPAALGYLKDRLHGEDYKVVSDLLGGDVETEEELAERKEREEAEDRKRADDRRRDAQDARRRLGRDETPEECDVRERAMDARHRLGRDETDEERGRREGEDARLRKRRADDAKRRLGRDESEEESSERMDRERGEDRKRADDHRRADDRKKHADDRRREAEDRLREANDARRREAADRMSREAEDLKRAGHHKAAEDRRREAEDVRHGRRRAEDAPLQARGMKPGGEVVDRKAMDAAISAALVDNDRRHAAIRDAERFVQPWLGNLPAMDHKTADDVYRVALSILGEDVTGVHPSAYKAILARIPKPGAVRREVPALAHDAAAAKGFADRFGAAAVAIKPI